MSENAGKTRELSERERAYIVNAAEKARILYDGVVVPHRSCGIALAETFALATSPYQSLRKGGITGEGVCGAIRAGELVLGELLGDPDPTGAVTPSLRAAMSWYRDEFPRRIPRGPSQDFVCNNLTRSLGEFRGPKRHSFCTNIAEQVAALTAEAVCRFGDGQQPGIIAVDKESGT
jgi:hypothetical protein